MPLDDDIINDIIDKIWDNAQYLGTKDEKAQGRDPGADDVFVDVAAKRALVSHSSSLVRSIMAEFSEPRNRLAVRLSNFYTDHGAAFSTQIFVIAYFPMP